MAQSTTDESAEDKKEMEQASAEGVETKQPQTEDVSAEERGFPQDVPPAQMSAEQQIAYWRHHSRAHESEKQRLRTQLAEAQKTAASEVTEYEAAKAQLLTKDVEIARLKAQHAHPEITDDVMTKLCLATEPEAIIQWADDYAATVSATVKPSEPSASDREFQRLAASADGAHKGGSASHTFDEGRERAKRLLGSKN